MPTILNLTQHKATPAQIKAGVIDLDSIMSEAGNPEVDNLAERHGFRQDQFGYFPTLNDCLTFDEIPTYGKMWTRAVLLTSIAARLGFKAVMIGGAGFFLPVLERALKQRGIKPLHAFTQRNGVETANTDGSVTKTNVFEHVGFVESGVEYCGDAPSWAASAEDDE